MRRSTLRTSRAFVVAGLLSLFAGPILAQSTFSRLTGTILDSSGAVLPGVRNVRSAQFGLITNTQTVDQAAPRTAQFSLRYSF